MSDETLDVVTGAFSYSGAAVAQKLLQSGRQVRTLTFHPSREHALAERVEAVPYAFDDPVALARSLRGAHTLYNTYWVRFERGATTFANAISNSRALFVAARSAGVSRIVHVSIANPSVGSRLPYYRGKALVERALADAGVSYAIVRPTWIFGGERDVLTNNIAWILRHAPVFAIPGDGTYPVQPVHIDDLTEICVEAARSGEDLTVDAAGPDRMTFEQLVVAVREAVGSRSPILHVPAAVMGLAAQGLGQLMRDVVLTGDEISGLTQGLLASAQPARGTVSFRGWIQEQGDTVGRAYANELARHFAI